MNPQVKKKSLDGLRTHRATLNDSNDLQSQYEKTKATLNNPHLTLPDGGAKLKAKLAQLESLLKNSLSDKVSELSLNDTLDVRQKTLIQSNQQQTPIQLLRAHAPSETDMSPPRGARMMSLEESMKLQESQQRDIQLANMRKRMEDVSKSKSEQESLADDLTVTMNRLQLNTDYETESDSDDEEYQDDEEEVYEDEGFEEEHEYDVRE
ncbi:uncharacterized protein B0P05DRAFT_584206 [Gilbertella persicaria]|uniref:uncharacterized protein n=1 Tax=Gilbertella persicaria TaxID=101096 RepID=UPI00221FD640|nr:uncharacterized protein B0P05DRAFT_584206 [Gilbertella persicaria]KAI8091085.1 hypothetical protein B0P05DRAFT_584206 [Gilbertella persicaria]